MMSIIKQLPLLRQRLLWLDHEKSFRTTKFTQELTIFRDNELST